TDRRACEGSIAFGHNQAVVDESHKYAVRDDDNVNGFTTSQPIRDGGLPRPDGGCGGHEFSLRKEFESGNELKICRSKSARGHDPDVICHSCLNLFNCTRVAIAYLTAIYPPKSVKDQGCMMPVRLRRRRIPGFTDPRRA